MRNKGKIKNRMDLFLTVIFIVLIVYVISMIAVLYLGFINSLKNEDDIFWDKNYFGFPGKDYGWIWGNYGSTLFEAFKVINGTQVHTMWSMFGTSLLYSVLVSITGIMSQVMVAYAVAKYEFKLKKVLYTIAIVVMLIPIVGSLASKVAIMEALHLRGSLIGICLMNSTYTGMYFLVFYASFQNISSTYSEAAQIDGAGHLSIFIKIMLPLLSSTIFAVFILQFIANWNDYYTPMIFMPERPTIAYRLLMIKSEAQIEDGLKLSASIFTCIPIIILFFIFRNKIMGNIAIGGIKG